MIDMLVSLYYNSNGLILLIPVMILAFYAQHKVKSVYKRYSQVRSTRGHTGYQAARTILDRYGLYHVLVEEGKGVLSDHYDPRSRIVRLSPAVYHGASVSAVGIAAHECGHAIQHEEQFAPLVLRNVIIPATGFGSKLAFPLLFIGFLLGLDSPIGTMLIWIGIFGFILMALFQLITLPVEFNASSRALTIIDEAFLLEEEERAGAKRVLNAAALTYVAALAATIAQIMRLLLIVGRRR